MNITLSLYLLSIVDGFLGALVILGVLGFLEANDYPVTLDPARKPGMKLFFAAIVTLVPNQKGLLMIFGGTEAYQALQSPEAREIGGKSLQLLNKKLDEALADSKKGESK